MLSYQHAYHAGNAADLHKHIVLASLLAKLTEKARGITYMESHAGRGLYDLDAPEARKTGEAAGGIDRVALAPDSSYARAIQAARAQHGARAYPGSPLIAQMLLRPQDRIILFELHQAEFAALKTALAHDAAPAPAATPVAVHRRDGWEGLLAAAPPKLRRGLVLIDPSYEIKSEYRTAAAMVRRLVARWPEAIVLIWYPILAACRHEALLSGLGALPVHRDEVRLCGAGGGMKGSGLALVNPPYGAGRLFAAAHAQAAGVIAPATPHPGRAPPRGYTGA